MIFSKVLAVEQLRADLDALRERVLTLEAALSAASTLSAEQAEQAAALVRLKAEFATFRAILQGRNEDRGALVLAIDALRREVAELHAERSAKCPDLAPKSWPKRLLRKLPGAPRRKR